MVPVPYLTLFVLTRDGKPVYASRNIEYVKRKFCQKLIVIGYPAEVIDAVKFVPDDSFFPVYTAKHPYLRENWNVFQVDSD